MNPEDVKLSINGQPIEGYASSHTLYVNVPLRERIVDMLNALHLLDPEALQRIMDTRVEINERLAADGVWPVAGGINTSGKATLGPLGIIQGVLKLDDPKAEPIGAVYSDDLSKLLGFK
jgi:hypothetical protein